METIEDWVKRLKDSRKTILVEGMKDKRRLTALGISNIITVANKPVYKVIEVLQKKNIKEVIILTDLDPAGRKLYARLHNGLERSKIKVDRTFREFLFKATDHAHIEGINA